MLGSAGRYGHVRTLCQILLSVLAQKKRLHLMFQFTSTLFDWATYHAAKYGHDGLATHI